MKWTWKHTSASIGTVLLIICLIVFIADRAKQNDVKDFVIIVKDIQTMIDKIIECENTNLSSIESLHNIDVSNVERLQKIDERLSVLDSLKCVLLAENFDINGKKITGLTADKRIELCQKIFNHMNQMQTDHNEEYNIMFGKYWVGDICIDIEDFNFEDKE